MVPRPGLLLIPLQLSPPPMMFFARRIRLVFKNAPDLDRRHQAPQRRPRSSHALRAGNLSRGRREPAPDPSSGTQTCPRKSLPFRRFLDIEIDAPDDIRSSNRLAWSSSLGGIIPSQLPNLSGA